MTEAPRRVSLADVARRAGVSPITVSRVSNGFPGVAEPTRQSVVDAMRELGYRPNGAARALKSGRFRTLGVILHSMSTTGNVRTVDAIAAAAAGHGYATTLLPVGAEAPFGSRGAFTRLQELAVDAIIVITEANLNRAESVALLPDVPVIVVDSAPGGGFRVIDTDQRAGARAAVRHLLHLGHPTVWHITGPADSFAGRQRTAAWRRTLRNAGRMVPPALVGDWTADSGYRAGLRLADEPECVAVFAGNDEMALGVLRAMRDRGRDVPDHVSVVGFDDIEVAANAIPPLTTVRQDFDQVGQRCVQEALSQVRHGRIRKPGANRTDTILVRPELVVRHSTAPSRAGHRR